VGRAGGGVALLALLLHATGGLAIGGESDVGAEFDRPTERPSSGIDGLVQTTVGGGRPPCPGGGASDDRAGSDMTEPRSRLTGRPADSQAPLAR